MAIAAEAYWEISRLIEQNPELRADLRRLVLTQDLLDLPTLVRELAEAQRRSAERLAGVEERVGRLEEAQVRTEEQLGRLGEAMAGLAEAQRRTEERVGRLEEAQIRTEERLGRLEESVAALAEAQRRSEERLAGVEERLAGVEERLAGVEERRGRREESGAPLAEAQRAAEEELRRVIIIVERLDNQVAKMRGRMLEIEYREKAVGFFGGILRRPFPVGLQEYDDALDAALSGEDLRDLFRVDLVVRGVPRGRPGASEVLLAIEVSAVVDIDDVRRALRRAGFLRTLGIPVIPTVGGEVVTAGAKERANELHVLLLEDGRHSNWPEALEHWGAA